MEREFVPKKTITIQLSVEMWERLEEIRAVFGLTKTKMLEKMIELAEKSVGGET